MQYYGRVVLLVITPLVAVFGLISMRTSAQDENNLQKQEDGSIAVAKYEQAKTIPISDRLITLDLTLDNHSPFEVTQLEGGLIRVEKEGAWTVGFTPYIRDANTGEIAVKVFQIYTIQRDNVAVGEGIVELQTLHAGNETNNHKENFTFGDSLFSIQIAAKENRFKPDKSKIYIQSQEGSGSCCVTCDGIRICGCSVVASCGSCCYPSCC